MPEQSPGSRIVFGCTDVDITLLSDERCLLRTGTNDYVIKVDPKSARALHRIVTSVVPKLTSGRPLRGQLTDAELALLTPYLGRLEAMGVLFSPGAAAAEAVGDERDLRLYTFVARRADDPDRVFLAVKAQPVDLYGPPRLVQAWAEVLSLQGLAVRVCDDWRTSGSPSVPHGSGLVVLVEVGDGGRLWRANQALSGAGVRWVPVQFSRATVRIGPWTAPGESACLACPGPRRRADPAGSTRPAEPPAPTSDEPAAPVDLRPGDAAVRHHNGTHDNGTHDNGTYDNGTRSNRMHGAAASWLTLQPGATTWAGGVVAHLALRALVPMGSDHPWGRMTTIDAVHLEQVAVRLWRDPHCAHCATRAAPAPAWVEV